MLDIDRDRRQSGTFTSTTPTTLSTAAAAAATGTTAPVVVPRPVGGGSQSVATTPELPGGFTVADSPGSGVRGALERHFRVRRESHDGDGGEGAKNSLRSQSSNATLPRSYRAPEIHE